MEKISVLKFVGVVLVWLFILKPCVGSTFSAWGGPGCDVPGEALGGCGECYGIGYHAGYNFQYSGQTVYLYSSNDCTGQVDTTLAVNTRECSSFGWNSFIIGC
ncbi:antimicrobial peptide 1-like [Cryptomeria japonica]|uniref:antimicrobial peptide 1-like n=1 Tax=Cryptomeria japonica TaxID=3369 RepID=UPI0027D9D849|nr:antimicrobial peptide 1-like [Cryptomeria japonica]